MYQRSKYKKVMAFFSLLNRDGENALDNFAQQVTGSNKSCLHAHS